MTQDEIIEMAEKAGFTRLEPYGNKLGTNPTECLKAFAKLVAADAAAKEREACAKLCDDIRHPWGYSAETPDWCKGTDHCAAAIRARGQE